jgi:CHAD domain-containing protein
VAYRIDLRKSLRKEFKRVGLEQIAACQVRIGARHGKPGQADGGVHDVRKGLKRIRALLVLAAPALGAEAARHERHRYRDLGRKLSERRDHDVMLRTLQSIETQFGLGWGGPLESIARALSAVEERPDIRVMSSRVAVGLERAAVAMAALDFSTIDDKTLIAALQGTYQDGRDGLRRARRDGDDETLHRWRKSVQLHWRHMRLVGDVWPGECDARMQAARLLSQQLGEHNDLGLLKTFVQQAKRGDVPRRDRDLVLQFVAIAQKQLRRSALPLGHILFAETVPSFGARFAAYCRRGRKVWAKSSKPQDKAVVDRLAVRKGGQ